MSTRALRWAAVSWTATAVASQLFFAFYVALYYGTTAARGNIADWNKAMPHGYVAGDFMGNLVVAAHLLSAVVIILGGALQLSPQVRRRAPRFHRWGGRVYIAAAFAVSLGGLFMVWTRGAVGGMPQHLSISVNAGLILLCAAQALRYARLRRFDLHRRWALRLFLVAGGVWFFRIGLMLWLAIHQGPAGFDPKTFQGPFLTFLGIAQYVLPLLTLELYLYARDRGGPPFRAAMAAGLAMLTLATACGSAVAVMGMWMPRLSRL
ncbi:MAG TPA: DUF2306 domain-containing protein [Bryobacteraceae bacterium]|nr:DUF2306 domain-containing protein [Bryobacteraceae bacterium]